MRIRLLHLLFLCCLPLFASAQRPAASEYGYVEISPTELQSMVQRMARLRQRRYALYQRQLAAQRGRERGMQGGREGAMGDPREVQIQVEIEYDTLIIIDPVSYASETQVIERRTTTRRMDGDVIVEQTERVISSEKDGPRTPRRVTALGPRPGSGMRIDTTIVIDPVTFREDTIISVVTAPVRPDVDLGRDGARQRGGDLDRDGAQRRGGARVSTAAPNTRTEVRSVPIVEDNRTPTVDTIIMVDPRTGRRDTSFTMVTPDFMMKPERTPTTPKSTGMTSAEAEDLRRRLDRQEELLLRLQRNLDREPTTRVLQDDNAEIQRLSVELDRMQRELDRERDLRRDLERDRYDERRRYAQEREDDYRQRELDIQRRLNDYDPNRPGEDYYDAPDRTPAERQEYYRQRQRAGRTRVNIGGTPRTRDQPATTPPVIRDTVYVEREVVREVPGAATRDTVVMVKETVREKPADPIIITNRVVKTDTVQLAAREPLSFPTIFFGNNSSTLNDNHRGILEDVAQQLFGRNDYDIVLTGYASPSGNADYNQRLSAKRARAVQDGLIAVGIDAGRIRLVPGGIDYQPASPAAARRVEVKALPKR